VSAIRIDFLWIARTQAPQGISEVFWNTVVCLFHGDYGPADPGFIVTRANAVGQSWVVDASLLKAARNRGEAEAIQRHISKGEAVSWCHQGYSWVDQPAIDWFYAAAFIFVVLPYLIMKLRAASRRCRQAARPRALATDVLQPRSSPERNSFAPASPDTR
jgi:hypothetical protein